MYRPLKAAIPLSLSLSVLLGACGAANLPPSATTPPGSDEPGLQQDLPPASGGSTSLPGFSAGAPGIQPGSGQPEIVIGTTPTHPANPHVLGTDRNQVAEYFPDGPAKLAKLRELAPTWGKGRYLYRVGHGITDGRVEYDYMTGYHFEDEWGKKGPYPYDDVRYALKDAKALGSDAMFVVNYGTGTAQEAADYVRYLNDPSCALRKQYPSDNRPVRMFEIGNEISWSHERGHDQYAPTDTAYAQRARRFAEAMRAASPVPIQIGAVATTNSNWLGDGWAGGAQTVKDILQTMGNQVDFLIFHGYPSWPLERSGDLLTVIAQNAWNRRKLQTEIFPAIARYSNGHPVGVANTEFSTELYGDPDHARGMFGALYSADSLATALDLGLETAVQFCLDHGDQADSSFFIGNDPDHVTPIFRVDRLLARHWGDQELPVSGQGVPTVHVQGSGTSIDMPLLGLAAARGNDGRVYALVVNRSDDQDVTIPVDFGRPVKSIVAHELLGPQGWNTGADGVERTDVPETPGAPIRFAASSVTILEAR